MIVVCEHCGKSIERRAGHVNRARKVGAKQYCNKTCFGLANRSPIQKTKEQKAAEKRAYDIEYRRKNLAVIKARKRAYFDRTYDPVKAAIERKKIMPRHVEYCRRPEYRAYKKGYDRQYRANKDFGPFADCFLLLTDIDKEVNARMTDYDVRLANGTLNKRQERKREHERLIRG